MTRHVLRVYRNKKNRWEWEVIAHNGVVVAQSSMSYRTKGGALSTFNSLCETIWREASLPVIVVGEKLEPVPPAWSVNAKRQRG